MSLYRLAILSLLSTSSLASPSINSHSSYSSSTTSRLAPTFDTTPILTLSSSTSSSNPYLCVPTSQCLPCSQTQMDSPICSIWGNQRKLICQPYSSSEPPTTSSIQDPDSQLDRLITSNTTTNTPSQYYEFEPEITEQREGEGSSGGGRIGKIGYQSSDELDQVITDDEDTKSSNEELAELREVLEAERRRKRSFLSLSNRRSSEIDQEPLLLVRYFDDNEKTKRGGGGGGVIETYEACPKVVKREQSDYFEFVLCNFAFALTGLAVLMYRQRTLAGRQFGKLVARIMQTEIR